MRRVILLAATGFAVFSLACPASSEPPVIRVTGEATLSVEPDRATVDIGVTTEDPKAGRAAQRNAEKAAATIEALREAFGKALQIQTVNYSLTPRYRYPKDGGPREQEGFTASNIVRVETQKLDRVGRIIDIATSKGANRIERLHFDLADEEPTRAQALRRAAATARAKAEAIAAALDLKIGRVISVEEGGVSVVSPQRSIKMMSARSAAVPTPVEAGTVEVNAQLTLSVEANP
ncbi:MAG: SIMPL domain-containing protein [Myxococcota bacterium]|nr:SIMPL domain-containing protein [Myxococcota bacterium]